MSAVNRVMLRGLLALCLGALGGAVAAAEGLGEVQELLKAGRAAEALRTLDTLIAQRPGDAQLRFQKGVILVDQKRSNEAIQVFQRLNQDFPALPEPFNNLAVLYVEQGQLDKARGALESAIRSRPNYGTAFQNLGDVYTRMASRAYARALQVEDPDAAPKLALIPRPLRHACDRADQRRCGHAAGETHHERGGSGAHHRRGCAAVARTRHGARRGGDRQ